MGAGSSRIIREKLRDITIEDQHIRETDEVLGTGSYGEVKVVNVYGLRCASKKIHKSLITDLNFGTSNILQKFVDECLHMSKVRHPNIVQLLGVYFTADSGMPALAMELLSIGLGDFLENYPNLPKCVKNSILYDVSLGLLYLHKQAPPVIHRDLTVNNVLLTRSLKAKVADLGVARVVNVKSPRALGRGPPMSICPGNAIVMPPEAVVSNATYGTKLDVFSFGHMIVHVVIQKWPMPLGEFESDPSTPEWEEKIRRTEVQRRQKYIDKMGEDHYLRPLAIQCLADDPKSRPNTEKIVEELERINAGRPEIPLSSLLDLLRSLESQTQALGDSEPTTPNDKSLVTGTAGGNGVTSLQQELKNLRETDEGKMATVVASEDAGTVVTPTVDSTQTSTQKAGTLPFPTVVVGIVGDFPPPMNPQEDLSSPAATSGDLTVGDAQTSPVEQAHPQSALTSGFTNVTTLRTPDVNGASPIPIQPDVHVASSEPHEETESMYQPRPVPRPRASSRKASRPRSLMESSYPAGYPAIVEQLSPSNGMADNLNTPGLQRPQPVPRKRAGTTADLYRLRKAVLNQSPGNTASSPHSTNKTTTFTEANEEVTASSPQALKQPHESKRAPRKTPDSNFEAILARRRRKMEETTVSERIQQLETRRAPPPQETRSDELVSILQRRRMKSDS